MSRRLLCAKCGEGYPKAINFTELYARSEYGEPAEYARIVKGTAKTPKAEQRVVYVNDNPTYLGTDSYNCDLCGCPIKAGDKVTCVSMWTDNRPAVPPWESEFINEQ